jgi:hypothetical protein
MKRLAWAVRIVNRAWVAVEVRRNAATRGMRMHDKTRRPIATALCAALMLALAIAIDAPIPRRAFASPPVEGFHASDRLARLRVRPESTNGISLPSAGRRNSIVSGSIGSPAVPQHRRIRQL